MTPRRRILAACVLGCAAALGVGVAAGPAMGCVAACIEGACIAISLLCRPTGNQGVSPNTPEVQPPPITDSPPDESQQLEEPTSSATNDESASAEAPHEAEHAPKTMPVPTSEQAADPVTEPTPTEAPSAPSRRRPQGPEKRQRRRRQGRALGQSAGNFQTRLRSGTFRDRIRHQQDFQ